jgi:hypothetical protein
MTARPVDACSSSQPSPAAQQAAPDEQPHDGENKGRAVAELLRHEVLRHTFGEHGEYEVRTTMATRRAWKYRCSVLRHGKEIKREFVPIIIDRTRRMRHIRNDLGAIEALRFRFAMEAVNVHFSRCAALREYAIMDPIFAQPPPPAHRRLHAMLFILIGAAFLTAYGFWKLTAWTSGGQVQENPSSWVREAEHPVVNQPLVEPPLSVSPPAFSDAPSRDIPARQADTASIPPPVEPPKAVRLLDLLALEPPPERTDHALGAPTPQGSPGATASDVHVGDLLRFTAWIHRVSRDLDGTYRLQVSASQRAGAPGLIAVLPHPDRVSGLPSVRAQLQTVRGFIKQRLLRQQEPSLRGSVMRRPVFVQLTGQLSYPDAPLSDSPQVRGPRGAMGHWEVRPVLDIHFATPSAPADRARVQ